MIIIIQSVRGEIVFGSMVVVGIRGCVGFKLGTRNRRGVL